MSQEDAAPVEGILNGALLGAMTIFVLYAVIDSIVTVVGWLR